MKRHQRSTIVLMVLLAPVAILAFLALIHINQRRASMIREVSLERVAAECEQRQFSARTCDSLVVEVQPLVWGPDYWTVNVISRDNPEFNASMQVDSNWIGTRVVNYFQNEN